MTEPCFEFLGAIQQIPIGYLFYILCVNTYIWNQGRWYWWAYLQGSDGNADTENRVKGTGRGEEGEMVRWIQRMSWKLYTSVCKRKALFRVWASWNRHAAGPCVCVKSMGLGDKTLRLESASLVSFLAPQVIKHPWTSIAFFSRKRVLTQHQCCNTSEGCTSNWWLWWWFKVCGYFYFIRNR